MAMRFPSAIYYRPIGCWICARSRPDLRIDCRRLTDCIIDLDLGLRQGPHGNLVAVGRLYPTAKYNTGSVVVERETRRLTDCTATGPRLHFPVTRGRKAVKTL